jgi:DNA repair protein RadD
MILRPYQTRTIEETRVLISHGTKLIVVVAPTGAGKTVMAADIIQSAERKGTRTLFLAHRKELIDQCHEKLSRFGVNAGVIMAKDPRRDDFLKSQVASVQTLRNRMDRLPSAGLVVVDECHHSTAQTYVELIKHYRAQGSVVLGLTATPWPAGRRGLKDIYDAMVLSATPAQLIAEGSLVSYDAFAYDAPDLHEVKTSLGDFNQKQLGLACNTEVLVGNVVAEYVKHALGRRGILFPVNVDHSMHLVAEFRAASVNAEHLDCHTPKVDRERILRGLASGDVQVVSSVGVLTEGFDCPAAEVCILARPTQSLPLFMQMCGRVLRPSPATGKVRALIHDHGGNFLRHGFPDDDRDYSLTVTPDRVRALHTCPFCDFIYGALTPEGTCPNCGQLIHESDERDPGMRGSKTVVDGVRLTADEIRVMRGERAKNGFRDDLTDEQIQLVADATREQRLAEFIRLRDIAIKRNFAKRWPDVQYRKLFGKWPRFSDADLANGKPAATPFVPLPPRERAA